MTDFERGVNPLMLVMVGDLTDINGFTELQFNRLGVRIPRKDIQHLVHRRRTNGCPEPLIPLRAAHIYQLSALQEWFDAYVLTHPHYMQGKLLEVVREARRREQES